MNRPVGCTNDMLVFLDVLRSEGRVGFGITEQIERRFKLSARDAVSVVSYWMATYGQDGAR